MNVPRLRVFAGPNGSGKSTLIRWLDPRWIGIYVNADDLERDVKASGAFDLAAYGLDADAPSRFERLKSWMRASVRLEDDQAAQLADSLSLEGAIVRCPCERMNSYIAATFTDFIRQELLQDGKSFTFETVMSHESKVEFLRSAQARGYRTYLYFIATEDVEINIDRVKQRVALNGHPVDEEKIRERYVRSIELLRVACDAANRTFIFDNSGEEAILVAEVTDGATLKVHERLVPAWVTRTTLWQEFQP